MFVEFSELEFLFFYFRLKVVFLYIMSKRTIQYKAANADLEGSENLGQNEAIIFSEGQKCQTVTEESFSV